MFFLVSLAFLACPSVSAEDSAKIRVLTQREETRGAGYWAIVPKAWIETLRPLAAHRAQEGFSVAMVPLELFSAHDGAKRSQAIREFFRSGFAQWKEKPRFLLLAAPPQESGVPPFLRDWSREDVKALESINPREYRSIASDQPFGDFDDDGLAEIAVGRLPARSAEELKAMVEKILAYENSPPGLWRRRVLLLGGLFGDPAVDAVVEKAVGGLLDREIPNDFDLQVLRAEEDSPYGVGIAQTRAFFTKQMEEGALVTIYAGHANPDHFATPVPGQIVWENLFTLEEARSMSVRRGAPLFLSFACHAGGFALDSKGSIRETLADTVMRNARGAIAYLGASGISHPLPDLLLAHELTQLFATQPQLRLGEWVNAAKRAMRENVEDPFHQQVAAGGNLFGLSEEKQVNLRRFEWWIYNLHGDPATRWQRPQEKVELSQRRVGDAIEVEGRLSGWSEGDAIVTLELPRSAIPAKGASWRQANDKTIAKAGAEIREGRFVATLSLHAALTPGRYILKAYASAQGRDASGWQSLEISQ